MQDSIKLNPENVSHWYALYTRSKFEKKVDLLLNEKGLESYLPLRTVQRRWSDRWKKVSEPLFSCYVFVRISLKQRLNAIQTCGVVRLVTFNETPTIIQDSEINAIKRILKQADYFEIMNYLAVGQMVEVIRGPFQGICGQFIEYRGQQKLLVGIEQIRQALAVEINKCDVAPLTVGASETNTTYDH